MPPGIPLEGLPRIDVVLLSHSHYDHLDAPTVRTFAVLQPDAVWCAPLGLGDFTRRLGVRRVEELDWWDERRIGHALVSATPAQHFSGRGLFDRNRSLWCGYTVRVGARSVYFAGDTAYHPGGEPGDGVAEAVGTLLDTDSFERKSPGLDVRAIASEVLVMPHVTAGPDFTVSVDGYFVPSGTWRIDARLRFRKGLNPQVGDPLLGHGRLAVVEAILQEATRGRMQGATSVRLHMDVDGDIREVSLEDLLGDSGPFH